PVVELCHISRVTAPPPSPPPVSPDPPEQATSPSAIRAAAAPAAPRALRIFMLCSPLHRVIAPLRGAVMRPRANAPTFYLLPATPICRGPTLTPTPPPCQSISI